MHYFIYLDEFGHIGHFVSRTHPKYKTNPVFGLGGIALPVNEIRNFSTFFYKFKDGLLKYDISKSKVHKAQWEMKGAKLYTIHNIKKYRSLRYATKRIINKISNLGGFIFYNGIEKDNPSEGHSPEGLYLTTLKAALRELNRHFSFGNHTFSLFLDSIDSPDGKRKFRLESIEAASISMFGREHCFSLLEPPYQLESHLYQNIQCADWFCGLLGRRFPYQVCPREYQDHKCVEEFFGEKIDSILKASKLKRRQTAKIISLPPKKLIGG